MDDCGTAAEQFDALYRAEYGRLVGALRLLCGDQRLAEDIGQETFVRAWLAWRRVSGLDRPAGWLYTTGFRLLYRRQRRKQAVSPAPADIIDPGEEAASRVALEAAVAALPSRQRQAVIARHVLGFDTAEAASVLGIRPDAFRALLHRAVVSLRKSPLLDEEIVP